MELKYGKQLDISHFSGEIIDLFLCAGNHEKRVFTAFDKLSPNNKILKAIVLCYKQFDCTIQNDNLTTVLINNHNHIYEILNEVINKSDKEEINIFVDYSCMTKSWYYSIILYLSNKEISLKRIKVYFSYTPSKYSPPQEPKPNSEIEPLPGKYVVPTDKPKALIVCLGYEQNKAEGIIEHLDPKISYIFYTKPTLDHQFEETLESNNSTILEERCKHVVTFPFQDLLYLERELTSLYFKLKDEYSVIIAPLGPKPFTFISMLMSVKYNDIDIWRVGSGSNINEYPREPFDQETFIISEVVWQNNVITDAIPLA
ncbi:hypothetical protein MRBLMN1_006260 [Chitinophaga ginsengisegetis]|uniref:hypothetical protein n=1 Tax=Chitinophaga ginsengisegetis TaxID=393003 RepID=UPI003436537A